MSDDITRAFSPDSAQRPQVDTSLAPNPLIGPEQHRFQFSLAKAFAVVTVACLGAALISWSPLVGGGAFAFVVSVASFTMVANYASLSGARVMAKVWQVVGLAGSIPLVCIAAMLLFVGLTQGTDTSLYANMSWAISGFGLLVLGVATCAALVASRRAFLRPVSAIAYAANGALLAIALYTVTNGVPGQRDIQQSIMCYGLALISVNAMSVRAAYLKRRDCRGSDTGAV